MVKEGASWTRGRKQQTLCRAGLHDLNDPQHLYVNPSNGVRYCRTCNNDKRRARGYNGRPVYYVTWQCPSCGTPREIRERTAFRYKSGESPGLCEDCRIIPRPDPGKFHGWWLERFPPGELRMLAAALEGWL